MPRTARYTRVYYFYVPTYLLCYIDADLNIQSFSPVSLCPVPLCRYLIYTRYSIIFLDRVYTLYTVFNCITILYIIQVKVPKSLKSLKLKSWNNARTVACIVVHVRGPWIDPGGQAFAGEGLSVGAAVTPTENFFFFQTTMKYLQWKDQFLKKQT